MPGGAISCQLKSRPAHPSPTAVAERRRAWLERSRLYLICEARPGGDEPEEVLRPALQAGVDIVQLRDKSARGPRDRRGGAGLPAALRRLRRALHRQRPAELAIACAADGVHLGQDDAGAGRGAARDRPRRADRPLDPFGASRSRRRATSTTSRSARCYATPTKPDYEPVGLELVRWAAEHAPRAVLRDRRHRPPATSTRCSTPAPAG